MPGAPLHPELTVSAYIFNPAGELLLCQSPKWNNQYVIPGGHVEWGEKLEDALRREVMEETGLEIADIQLASLHESIASPRFQTSRHFIFIDYFCKTHHTDVHLNEEATRYVWASLSDALSYDLGGYLREFITALLQPDSPFRQTIYYGYSQP